MINIQNVKRLSNEILEYQLENNDKILLLDKEIEKMGELHKSNIFESIEGKQYYAVLSDTEYGDEFAEIIGFELVKVC